MVALQGPIFIGREHTNPLKTLLHEPLSRKLCPFGSQPAPYEFLACVILAIVIPSIVINTAYARAFWRLYGAHRTWVTSARALTVLLGQESIKVSFAPAVCELFTLARRSIKIPAFQHRLARSAIRRQVTYWTRDRSTYSIAIFYGFIAVAVTRTSSVNEILALTGLCVVEITRKSSFTWPGNIRKVVDRAAWIATVSCRAGTVAE